MKKFKIKILCILIVVFVLALIILGRVNQLNIVVHYNYDYFKNSNFEALVNINYKSSGSYNYISKGKIKITLIDKNNKKVKLENDEVEFQNEYMQNISFKIPADIESGIYTVKLTAISGICYGTNEFKIEILGDEENQESYDLADIDTANDTEHFEIEILPEYQTIIQNFDNNIYILTKKASGKPVKTSGEISINTIKKEFETDETGIAKVELTSDEIATISTKISMDVVAKDENGIEETQSKIFYSVGKTILLETDKIIYNQGETIKVKLESYEQDVNNEIYVYQGDKLLKTAFSENDEIEINLEDVTGIINIYTPKLSSMTEYNSLDKLWNLNKTNNCKRIFIESDKSSGEIIPLNEMLTDFVEYNVRVSSGIETDLVCYYNTTSLSEKNLKNLKNSLIDFMLIVIETVLILLLFSKQKEDVFEFIEDFLILPFLLVLSVFFILCNAGIVLCFIAIYIANSKKKFNILNLIITLIKVCIFWGAIILISNFVGATSVVIVSLLYTILRRIYNSRKLKDCLNKDGKIEINIMEIIVLIIFIIVLGLSNYNKNNIIAIDDIDYSKYEKYYIKESIDSDELELL